MGADENSNSEVDKLLYQLAVNPSLGGSLTEEEIRPEADAPLAQKIVEGKA
ncbi:MAG: hypothetical protein M1470_09245 [Bacteroidetes bacterium]|nr:hypothetical protein [Bacteroidota bacterium]MCL5737862.1 hypothetical protein [Bacteroidota bacterium]